MLEQQVRELPTPSPPSIRDGGEDLGQINRERPSALLQPMSLLVAASASLLGQTSVRPADVRRFSLRVTFSVARFRSVPNDEALENRYTFFEKEVYARLPGWRR